MKRALEEYLVVCDLENALLSAPGGIPAVDRTMIRLLEGRGGRFTVATDRTPEALRQILGDIRLTAPAICCGGAVLYDLAADQLLASHGMDPDLAKAAITELLGQFPKMGVAVMGQDGDLRVTHMSRQLRVWLRQQGTGYYLEQLEDVRGALQKAVFCGEPSRVDFLEQYAKERNLGDGLRCLRIDHSVLSLQPAAATRGTALLELARLCGVAPSDCVYIGGCGEAQEAMCLAGHTAAVKGAPPRVLLAADAVTTISASEGGAAEFLYQMVRRHETNK